MATMALPLPLPPPRAGSVYVAAPPDSTPGRKFNWRRFWRRFWKWGILVMGLVCLGFCTWGAVESINESNHTISDFWDVLHAVQDVVSPPPEGGSDGVRKEGEAGACNTGGAQWGSAAGHRSEIRKTWPSSAP